MIASLYRKHIPRQWGSDRWIAIFMKDVLQVDQLNLTPTLLMFLMSTARDYRGCGVLMGPFIADIASDKV